MIDGRFVMATPPYSPSREMDPRNMAAVGSSVIDSMTWPHLSRAWSGGGPEGATGLGLASTGGGVAGVVATGRGVVAASAVGVRPALPESESLRNRRPTRATIATTANAAIAARRP